MKNILISLFILFFLGLSSPAGAYDIIIGGGTCPDGVLYKSYMKIYDGAVDEISCETAVEAYRDFIMNNEVFEGSCIAGMRVAVPCYSMYVDVCCDGEDIAGTDFRTNILFASGVVEEVPVGGEKDAAEIYFNQYKGTVEFPALDGYTVTDRYDGYIYTGELAVDGETVGLNVQAWTRGGYTKNGVNPIPLGELAMGPGGLGSSPENPVHVTGGGIGSPEEFAGGVKEGVEGAFGQYEGDEPGIKTYDTQGPVQHSADMPEGFDVWPDTPEKDSITDKIMGFMENHPVMGILHDSEIEFSEGSCSLDTTFRGRDVSFSLCRFADFFSFFGSILLGVTSIYCVYIIFGRG